jgi:acyl dehydratase
MISRGGPGAIGDLVHRRWAPVRGADPVERTGIRRFVESLEWNEPIHHDVAAARAAGHRNLVAPTASHTAFAMPPYWSPGDPPLRPDQVPVLPRMAFFDDFPAGTRTIALGFRRDWHADVVVGDRLACGYEVLRVTPKRTRIAEGAIVEIAARYADQKDRPVSTGTLRVFNYAPVEREPPADPQLRHAQPDDPGVHVERLAITHTPQRLAMWAGANLDFAPWHHDREYARGGGAPDMFANTFFIEALYERLLRRLAGSTGTVESIDFRIASFLLPAPEVEVRAVATEPLSPGVRTAVAIVAGRA